MIRPYRLDDGPVVLAVDIGTSRTKGGLIAARAGLVTEPTARPTSTDPDLLLATISAMIDELVEGAPAPLSAVVFSSYWHGLVCLAEGDEPMGPITTWQSTSGAASAASLAERLDPKEYHALSGCFLHPSYPYVRMHTLATWPSRHEVRWLMSPADWVFARLFGQHVTSPSMASGTGLTPVGGRSYDPALLEAAEIAASELPAISDDPLSGLTGEWAERWPALSTIPWFLAVGDGACSTIGSGCANVSRAAMNMGTSGAVRVLTEGYPHPPDGLFVYSAPGDRALVGGATSNAGNVLWWAKETFRLPEDAIGRVLARRSSGTPVKARAHLAGQRAPGWPLDSTGVIEGIRSGTTSLDLLKAFVDSIVDDLCTVVERLDDWTNEPAMLVASGGLIEDDPAWARILTERIGRPLFAAASAEAGLMGAAAFAFELMGYERAEPDLSPF